MFYGQFVLSKKGPLSKIWLAAHWERKLSKAQIYETNVQDAVDEILKPKVKLSLRTTGHLMLGLVRIYSRKAKYVLADCNEAFLKIKMAFRPGGATDTEFRERERDEGPPDIMEDFFVPDILDELGPMAGIIGGDYQSNQSHIDQITLNDEISRQHNIFDPELGEDDFGERALEMEEELEGPRDHLSIGDLSNRPSTSRMAPSPFDDFARKSNLFDDIAPAEELDLELYNMHNGDAGVGIDDDGVLEPMDVDGGGHGDKAPAPAQDSFVLEPLDTATLKQQHQEKAAGRGKRKRRLIVDEPKNISGDDMKANMADYSDTISSIDLAPPTKQLMRMRESSVVEKILSTPGCSIAIHDQQMLRLYQSHLVLHAKELDERNSTISDVRRDLELEVLDLGEDRYSLDLDAGGAHSPIVENGVGAEDDESEEGAHAGPKTTIGGGSAERKSRKSRAHEREEEEEDEDEQVFNRRTKNILNSIAVKLRANDNRILFEDLFTKGSTRRTAAQKFYALLELHKWQAIQVQQAEPFGSIEIFGGERMNELLTSA